MLPTGFIADLLSRVDIVEVVGRQVDLKKAGINHKGLCPFHGEKSPSFIVSPSRQTYHCFGCGAHGDAIRFLTEHHGLPFMDAVRDLAQQAGMTVPEATSNPEDRARASAEKAQRATLSDVLAKASDHYRQALKGQPRAVAYLKKRGLTGAIAARFGLGYAPEGWRSLASAFARYDDPLLVEAGLVIASGGEGSDSPEAEQKRYDRFRDRIMFPIRSVRGEVIGFGGRVLDKGEPKYLNSPETPVFHKGQELYGLFEARQGLRAKGYALVVEGYMDVVALAQWGFPNAVATLGTACTAEHVAKLFRFTDSVVFSFDGDAAGRRAAGRALEAALPHASDTRSIRFLFLPTEHDPDSYVRELGPEAFDQAVAAAVPLSAQLVVQAGADCDLATAEGRARMLAQAGPLVDLLPEGLLRDQVVADLAQRGGLAVDALQAHWARRSSGRQRASRDNPPPATTLDADAPDPRDGAPAESRRGGWRGRDGGWSPRPRFQAMGGVRTPPQTATLLDRMAWLLARNTALWLDMPGETHDFLAGQPAPYSAFFAELERVLMDHGPIATPALFDELRQGHSADTLLPLIDRLAGFHLFDDDEPAEALAAAVLWQLVKKSVEDESKLLFESGELSDQAKARGEELVELTKQLKKPNAVKNLHLLTRVPANPA